MKTFKASNLTLNNVGKELTHYKKNFNKAILRNHKIAGSLFALVIGYLLITAMPIFGFSAGVSIGSGLFMAIALLTITFAQSIKKWRYILPFGILAINAFTCNYGLSDTGTGCTPIIQVLKKIIIVPYYNNSGAQNTIPLSNPGTVALSSGTVTGTGTSFLTTFKVGQVMSIDSVTHGLEITAISSATSLTVNDTTTSVSAGATYNTFNNNFITNMVNMSDPSARWYPLAFMKNAENKRDTSIMETFNDNTMAKVQQGVRKLTGKIVGRDVSPQLKSVLDTFNSTPFGIYGIDALGNLIGTINTAGFLDPIRIDENSWDPIYNPGTDKTIQSIDINCNIHSDELDGNLNVIAAASMDPSTNLKNITGLLYITPVFSVTAHATNALVMQLNTNFGDAKNPLTDKGLVLANLTYVLTGTISSDTITITEGKDVNGQGNGIYTIVVSGTPSAGDTITIKPTRLGRDYSLVAATTVAYT